MSKERTAANGMGFFSWLLLLFIGLKLTGYIDWSWWWVLSPFWGPLVLALSFLAVYLAFFHRSSP